ncbi:Hypothetical predicted protein [Cloeon dipterum]|uniref:Uncharacterized protein n=1 Tax=Cloeon dipterum TaxID=197152 RepID=A0A8S1E239_9INSE|nr:Hypothetical predicted protein [Cloeon dipterum]
MVAHCPAAGALLGALPPARSDDAPVTCQRASHGRRDALPTLSEAFPRLAKGFERWRTARAAAGHLPAHWRHSVWVARRRLPHRVRGVARWREPERCAPAWQPNRATGTPAREVGAEPPTLSEASHGRRDASRTLSEASHGRREPERWRTARQPGHRRRTGALAREASDASRTLSEASHGRREPEQSAHLPAAATPPAGRRTRSGCITLRRLRHHARGVARRRAKFSKYPCFCDASGTMPEASHVFRSKIF